jgi:rhodanese-related sulfurtransferase
MLHRLAQRYQRRPLSLFYYQLAMEPITSAQLAKRIQLSASNEDAKTTADEDLIKPLSFERQLMIIDVRDEDFTGGNIIGARNIPAHEFEAAIPALIKETCKSDIVKPYDVVFHCMLSRQRGPTCCDKFLAHLYDEVQDYDSHPNV